MRYDPISNTDIAVMARLTRLGHPPEEAHGAVILLYLLEAVGSRFRLTRYHAVKLTIPPHLDARVRSDPEADRLIRAWWPALTNAVRARDIVRSEAEREERERKRRERIRGKWMTLGESLQEHGPRERPS